MPIHTPDVSLKLPGQSTNTAGWDDDSKCLNLINSQNQKQYEGNSLDTHVHVCVHCGEICI